jgi:hypothetical protein
VAALGERVGDATPEDIFHYLYAVLHAPSYRERYQALLKMDYARVPLPWDAERFGELARLGGELVRLHLLGGVAPARAVRFRSGGEPIGTVRYEPGAGRVMLNDAGGCFEGVSPAVWAFHVGGYPVCRKWLKGRRGRRLGRRGALLFRRIVAAIEGTLGLMAAVDGVTGPTRRP